MQELENSPKLLVTSGPFYKIKIRDDVTIEGYKTFGDHDKQSVDESSQPTRPDPLRLI